MAFTHRVDQLKKSLKNILFTFWGEAWVCHDVLEDDRQVVLAGPRVWILVLKRGGFICWATAPNRSVLISHWLCWDILSGGFDLWTVFLSALMYATWPAFSGLRDSCLNNSTACESVRLPLVLRWASVGKKGQRNLFQKWQTFGVFHGMYVLSQNVSLLSLKSKCSPLVFYVWIY